MRKVEYLKNIMCAFKYMYKKNVKSTTNKKNTMRTFIQKEHNAYIYTKRTQCVHLYKKNTMRTFIQKEHNAYF